MSKTKTSRTKRTRPKDEGAAVDPRLMKALSHPLRQRILQALNQRVASPAELSEELGESLGNVSYHVKILAELEAIELVRTAPGSRCARALLPADGALVHRRGALGRASSVHPAGPLRPDAPADLGSPRRRRRRKTSSPATSESIVWVDLELDEQGVDELNAALDETLERAMEIQSEAISRLAELSTTTSAPRRLHRTELAFHALSPRREDARHRSEAAQEAHQVLTP